MRNKQLLYKAEILKHFYFAGSLSCSDLSALTQKSLPLTTRLLNELAEAGLVADSGLAESTGGRRAQMYSLVSDFMYVVTVAMDQYVTRISIADLLNRFVIAPVEFELRLPENPQSLKQLGSLVENYINNCGIERSKLLGVGIGMPGFIDVKKGINYSFLTPAPGESVVSYLKKKIGLPVFIDNDSSLVALAESKFGEAKGRHNCMVINIGWGVGLGLVLNDQLFRGNNGFAGEFSHIPLFTNNKICSCGKLGCLETESSLVVLVNKAREGLLSGRSTSLPAGFDKLPLEEAVKVVLEAANRGDRFVVELLGEIGYNIGRGIAILIHILNPAHIVLSGRGAEAGNLWLAPVQKAINEHCIPRISEKTTVSVSSICREAEMIGAAALVMEHLDRTDFSKNVLAEQELVPVPGR